MSEKSILVLNTIDIQGNKSNAAKSQCKKKSKKKVLIMWKPMNMYVEKEKKIKGHAILTDLNFNVIYMERT